jgi:hypothetical protein
MRLDIPSPWSLLVSGKKNGDSTQSKAAKQAWSGVNSSAGFQPAGFDLRWIVRSQKKTG